MMQPRCAVCDGDSELLTLCDLHARLAHVKAAVLRGERSDWQPPLAAPQRHAEMMTSDAIAYGRARRLRERGDGGIVREAVLMAELATLLTCRWVLFSLTPEDSAGDWLARYGLLDWGDDDSNGKGRAA